MAAPAKRRTTRDRLDREIETCMAKLAVEMGMARTVADGRKQFREIYNTIDWGETLRRRPRLRVLAGGRA